MEDISNNIINLISDLETEMQNIGNNTGYLYQQFQGQPMRPIFNPSIFQQSVEDSISEPDNIGSFDSFINYMISGSLNPTTQQNMRSILEQSFQEKNKYKKVISEKGLNDIKKIIFDESMEQKTCPIFMTKFKIGEEVSQLPCKHIFNTMAIEKWLKEEQHVCPVCRYELDFNEEKIENSLHLEHTLDLSNNVMDLSNNVMDLSNNVMDLSNNVMDISNNRFQNLLFNFAMNELQRNISRRIPPLQDSDLENVLDVESEMLNDRFLQQAIMDSLND